MNKKGIIDHDNEGGTLFMMFTKLLLMLLLLFGAYFFGNQAYQAYQEYKEYKSFCEERPNFCYCDYWGCEFKIRTWTSTSTTSGNNFANTSLSKGMSEDTKALCELATKLNDKKTLFEIGDCNEDSKN